MGKKLKALQDGLQTAVWYRCYLEKRFARGVLGWIFGLWSLSMLIVYSCFLFDIIRDKPVVLLAITMTEMCVVFLGLVFLGALTWRVDTEAHRFIRTEGAPPMPIGDAKALVISRGNVNNDVDYFYEASPWVFLQVFAVVVLIFGTSYGSAAYSSAADFPNRFYAGHYTTAGTENGIFVFTNATADGNASTIDTASFRVWIYRLLIFAIIAIKSAYLVGRFYDRSIIAPMRGKLAHLRKLKKGGAQHVPSAEAALLASDGKSVPLETMI